MNDKKQLDKQKKHSAWPGVWIYLLNQTYFYLGACHRIVRSQISGKASELGPSYFYIGGCHRIVLQIRGEASELGPSYFYLGAGKGGRDGRW